MFFKALNLLFRTAALFLATTPTICSANDYLAIHPPLPTFVKAEFAVTQDQLIPMVVYSHTFNNAWAVTPNKVTINTQVTLRSPATGSLPAGSKAMRITTSASGGTVGITLAGSAYTSIDPTRIKSLSFAIYFPRGQTVANSVGIKLGDPFKRKFPRVKIGVSNLHPLKNYPGWYQVDLSIETLNPNNTSFNRINIVNLSPTGRKRIFYLDNIEFHGR